MTIRRTAAQWLWMAAGLLALDARLAVGQHPEGQHPKAPVGVQVGYSRAAFGGRDGPNLNGRQGALAGAYLTGRLSPGLAIQPELLFALKGGRLLGTVDGAPASYDVELAYLEMPVVAKVAPLSGHRTLHPVVFAGPAPSVRIGCDLERSFESGPQRTACEDITGFGFTRLDMGAVVGAGMQLDWAETALAIEVRYTVGLRDALEGTRDIRNRQLGVMLALNF